MIHYCLACEFWAKMLMHVIFLCLCKEMNKKRENDRDKKDRTRLECSDETMIFLEGFCINSVFVDVGQPLVSVRCTT